MFYERVLDLAPETRLERRLAERLAARFVIGLLLAIPVCVIGTVMLVSGVVRALVAWICDAGFLAGLRIRDGIGTVSAMRTASCRRCRPSGTPDRIRGW